MKEFFRKFANKTSYATGTAMAFIIALSVIVVWGITGPAFGFSDTWQLVINTGTTIVTFLMVFLIQNSQNRDGKAIQLKLDELIQATKGARNTLIDLENMSDGELDALDSEFKAVHDKLTPNTKLHTIHKRIEAEKERRLSLKSAGQTITNILKTPLNSHKDESDKKS